MKMEIDAARLLVWRASWMGRTGREFEAAEGSMSKLKAGEVAVWATERAIQILGGNGYTREFPVERMHRDAKIYTIFEGTSRDPAAGHQPRAISGMQIRVTATRSTGRGADRPAPSAQAGGEGAVFLEVLVRRAVLAPGSGSRWQASPERRERVAPGRTALAPGRNALASMRST